MTALQQPVRQVKRIPRVAAVSGLLAVLAVPASAQTMIPPIPGSALGIGYDTATGQLRGACVSGTLQEAQVRGADVRYNIHNVTSSRELRATESLSASASLGLGATSMTAAYSFNQSTRASRFHEWLVLGVRVENERAELGRATLTLTNRAKKLLSDPAKFRRFCGDRFLVALSKGGEFQVTYSMSSSTDSLQQTLHASLSTVSTWGSFNASAAKELEEILKKYEVQASIVRRGPSEVLPDPKDVNALQAYALNYPSTVAPGSDKQYTTGYYLADYGIVATVPSHAPAQAFYLDQLGAFFETVWSARSSIQYMLDATPAGTISEQFGPFNRARAETLVKELDQQALLVSKVAKECAAKEAACSGFDFTWTVPRVPGRQNIVTIDPKQPALTTLGHTGSDASLVLARGAGQWYAHCPGCGGGTQGPYPWTQSYQLTVRSTITGKMVDISADRVPFRVPPYSDVLFRVADSTYTDNQNVSGDPVRLFLFEALFPDEYGFPTEVKSASWPALSQ